MARIMAGRVRIVILSAAVAISFGCATFAARGPAFTATSKVAPDPLQPKSVATHQAMLRAEVDARDQIMFQASQLKLSDGRKLQDLAIVDATLRAQIDDIVRAAQIIDKDYNDDGSVSVTVRLDLQPLYDAIEAYPANKVQ
jgi:hypothetical protein